MDDKTNADRQARGDKISQSKLTDQQIVEIYLSTEGTTALAKKYTVVVDRYGLYNQAKVGAGSQKTLN